MIGSVLAMILGMALGFRAVLALAAVCYLLAWGAVLFRTTTGRALQEARTARVLPLE